MGIFGGWSLTKRRALRGKRTVELPEDAVQRLGWGAAGGVPAVVLLPLFALMLLYRRVHHLREIVFHLRGPDVPIAVLDAVREAESYFYHHLSLPRRLAEDLQDIACFVWPGLIYRLDASVGPYRIKAHSVVGLLGYAVERGYLAPVRPQDSRHAKLVPYFAMQPVMNEWQAALLLQHLKEQHPLLAPLDWSAIAADRRLIAKLYSGYMGAGGDWETWRATLEPGAVARERLGLA